MSFDLNIILLAKCNDADYLGHAFTDRSPSVVLSIKVAANVLTSSYHGPV